VHQNSPSWHILEHIVRLIVITLTIDAMASTWICVLVNYFVVGWFAQTIDQYYMDSFSILITVSFVFTIFGPLFNAILRYRCKMDSFGHALVENYMWTPVFIIFFGGLSMHISWALICYLLSIDMQWGATAKVLDKST
jgi:H+/Cl- antiporter ClcA